MKSCKDEVMLRNKGKSNNSVTPNIKVYDTPGEDKTLRLGNL